MIENNYLTTLTYLNKLKDLEYSSNISNNEILFNLFNSLSNDGYICNNNNNNNNIITTNSITSTTSKNY